MGKRILRAGSVLGGIALAAAFYINFEIFEIESIFMYPTLEPGQRLLVQKTAGDSAAEGDLVLFEAPFYDFDTQDGMLAVRRISGISGENVTLKCDAPAVYGDVLTVDRSKIRGKVIELKELTKLTG